LAAATVLTGQAFFCLKERYERSSATAYPVSQSAMVGSTW